MNAQNREIAVVDINGQSNIVKCPAENMEHMTTSAGEHLKF